MGLLSDAISFGLKVLLWISALVMIAICSIIFFAVYGLYLLANAILYGTNLVIFGLNIIVSPFALAIKSMIDGIDETIKKIKKFFDDLVNFFKKLFG
jgi:hypothetical protein